MLWPRDVVAVPRRWIENAKNLLTVMTPVMAGGTGGDRIVGPVILTYLGAIAAAATGTVGNADAEIAIGTSTTMAVGGVADEAFLTPSRCIRIMTYPAFADVAELADAQVSEACDGDIVEVQVLSSAPKN